MNQNKKTADPSACVHCHLCQKNCVFLDRYGIDIGDTEKLQKLAMHCFLCGKCSRVCPKGIDGRGVILEMRSQAAARNGGRRRITASGTTGMGPEEVCCLPDVISLPSTRRRPDIWRNCCGRRLVWVQFLTAAGSRWRSWE